MPSSFLFLLAFATSFDVSKASPDCQSNVHNETIAYFNSAPVTFSYELETARDCKKWCESVPSCQSWIYVRQSNQCDLHRTVALSVSHNAGFMFGGCKPIGDTNVTQLASTASPSSHGTATRTFGASQSVTLQTSTAPETVRHRHKRHH
ncbi:hypothetical protein POX_a01610 [Penicillium oxalicum]|uniref:hypothetical protein n=1 Tax=Penicillium oxalicum TaxID=69781 RepID=UPI0020B6BDBA|nr:hypothetical protein POX_a01610 [Penicillium oxalicum]KAI2795007.1 hypothetical protein POX_a01610 [Penicillium oxalicum]